MKLDRGFKVLGLVGIQVFAQAIAWAGEYPMSGQDTVLKLNGRASLSLMDKDHKELLLNDGAKYRFRLSNGSKSFHIMAGKGARQEFKVQGGFPGGDLNNLSIRGEVWGNPGVTFAKKSYTIETSAHDQVQTSGCTYGCGQDYICRQIPRQECRTEERRECRESSARVCHGEGPNARCREEKAQECHPVREQHCRDYFEQVCGYETRYCSGSETYTQHYNTTEDRQDFMLIDESSSEQMALFRDIEGTHSGSFRVNTIEACH